VCDGRVALALNKEQVLARGADRHLRRRRHGENVADIFRRLLIAFLGFRGLGRALEEKEQQGTEDQAEGDQQAAHAHGVLLKGAALQGPSSWVVPVRSVYSAAWRVGAGRVICGESWRRARAESYRQPRPLSPEAGARGERNGHPLPDSESE